VASRGRPVHINRHGNVTIFLRGRHLFVTAGCNGASKSDQIMKPRQLFVDVVKRTTAALVATARLVGPTGVKLAHPPNHERQKSEHAVQRLRHKSQGNLLPMG
jgi:hypothetical protein